MTSLEPMSRKPQSTQREPAIEIRRGSWADIHRLVDISRKSLKDELGLYGTGGQWKLFLDSPYCETWVCLFNGTIAAYAVAILDINRYKEDKARHNLTLTSYLLTLMTHPTVLLSKVLNRVYSLHRRRACEAVTTSPTEPAEKCLWVELLAVSPELRKKGFGTALLRFCEQRAAQLERGTIKLPVNRKNSIAMEFYRKLGFTLTHSEKYSCIYTKFIEH